MPALRPSRPSRPSRLRNLTPHPAPRPSRCRALRAPQASQARHARRAPHVPRALATSRPSRPSLPSCCRAPGAVAPGGKHREPGAGERSPLVQLSEGQAGGGEGGCVPKTWARKMIEETGSKRNMAEKRQLFVEMRDQNFDVL